MNTHSLIGLVGAFALSSWSFGQVTVDGMVDASYGDALAVQDTRTGFGDADHQRVQAQTVDHLRRYLVVRNTLHVIGRAAHHHRLLRHTLLD